VQSYIQGGLQDTAYRVDRRILYTEWTAGYYIQGRLQDIAYRVDCRILRTGWTAGHYIQGGLQDTKEVKLSIYCNAFCTVDEYLNYNIKENALWRF
jgi:hypothetical protein